MIVLGFLLSILLAPYLDTSWGSDITNKTQAGYFSESFVRLFTYSIIKSPGELEVLLKPGKDIANTMYRDGKLNFLGDLADTYFYIFFQRLHFNKHNDTISYLKDLITYMEERRELCTKSMNEIIDLANSIVDKTDGEYIYALINEYKNFPHVNKSGEMLCRQLMEAFIKPFWRKRNTSEMESLIENINHLAIDGDQCNQSFKSTTTDYNITEQLTHTIIPKTVHRTYNKTDPEGYLIQAYLRFLEVIINKKDYRARQILKHATNIATAKENKGEFYWMGPKKRIIPSIIGAYFAFTRISILKAEIPERFYNKMKNRNETFDEDLNDLINFANKFVTENQKNQLFKVIEEFSNFPDSTKTAKEICADLMDAFNTPFRENKNKLKMDNFYAEAIRLLRREYNEEKYAHLFEDEDPEIYW